MPCKPIRYPVEATGRHVPATQKQWKNDLMIDDSPIRKRTSLQSPPPLPANEAETRRVDTAAIANPVDDGAAGPAWFGDRS